ncbi:MAG TPA: ParB/RepB/Spo0J family partition protein, partial [Dehalococcoidia bacterium]|nr:ParB/RepB/Spo0J family partition protein [Dehalococcoidia bacterium]
MTTKTKAKQSDRSDVAILLDIYSLLPNPYQPESRVAVSMEVGAQFGNSIKEHGLIQPIIVRLKDGEYEVGDGWLRVCGYRWLDGNDGSWSEIPGIVRDLTDQQMADLVMEANTIRKDLNPIELAGFYKRYLEDFGITQAELARRHHCSQGEIANTVRLLELPDDVRQKVISQEISEAGGRQLLRLNTRPELQA